MPAKKTKIGTELEMDIMRRSIIELERSSDVAMKTRVVNWLVAQSLREPVAPVAASAQIGLQGLPE